MGDGRAEVEVCDHKGTTDASTAVSVCSECGKTWPTRFGAGAATVRVISKVDAG